MPSPLPPPDPHLNGDGEDLEESVAMESGAPESAMAPELRHVVEALLFAADAPLSLSRMLSALDNAGVSSPDRSPDSPPDNSLDAATLRQILSDLKEEYDMRGGGFFLCEAAGGYQLRTRSSCQTAVRAMLQSAPARLSRPAMETLAAVAYRQPVLRSEIDHIRGVDSGGVLRTLMDRKLVRIMGRKEIPGRPLLYGTTPRFMEVFGLNSLKDLPRLKEISEEEDAAVLPLLADVSLSEAEGFSNSNESGHEDEDEDEGTEKLL